MLCYRCGSYNADGSKRCSVCGQAFANQRRSSRNLSAPPTPVRVKAPFEAGSRIAARYRVLGGVAQGAAGWVLRARDEEVDVDVAIKVVSPKLMQTSGDRDLFYKAVKAAQRAQHANVVRIYDDGESDSENVFYTMPYLEGLTLRKIVDLRLDKGQVFTISEALPLFGQLALGLDALDKLGVHGALRPTSVVVLPDVLKITGLPHWHGLPRRPFVAQLGNDHSVDYLAPEARHDGAQIDPAADVYSMAAIFGEMLIGRVFGREPTAWGAAQALLPRRVAAVLTQALASKPSERFASAGAFFDALAEAVADMQLEQSEPSQPVSLGEPSRPHMIGEESTAVEGRLGALLEESSKEGLSPSSPFAMPMESSSPSASSGPLAPSVVAHDLHFLSALADRGGDRHGGGGGTVGDGPFWRIVFVLAVLAAALAGGAYYYYQHRSVRAPAEAARGRAGSAAAPVAAGATEAPSVAASAVASTASAPSVATAPAASAPAPVAAVEPAPVASPATARGERAPAKAHLARPEPASGKPAPEPSPVAAAAVPAGGSSGCPAGMVEIPAGSFQMGSSARDPLRGFGELDVQSVTLPAYCIDVYEYPNQRGKLPTIGVTFAKAKQLCEKGNKRLCSESEWERACKGSTNAIFAFGNSFAAGVCNLATAAGSGKPAVPSGQLERCKSSFGVADLSGNVAEWTSSRWGDELFDKVVKGGSSDEATYAGRCAARVNEAMGGKRDTLGLRCCAER